MSKPRTWTRYRRYQRRMEMPMLVASVVFIPMLIVPWLVDDLPRAVRSAMTVGDWAIWLFFVAQLMVLIYLAPDRRRVARTHALDIIIVATPFLQPVRKLRSLRLLRVAALAGRAGQAMKRLTARSGFQWFLGFVTLLMACGGVLVFLAERGNADASITSVDDGLWWALVTTTTVGYGDEYPISTEGRVIAAGLMLLGISLISVVTARIAAFFVATEDDGLDEIARRLERIETRLDLDDPGPRPGPASRAPRPDAGLPDSYEQLSPWQRREVDQLIERFLDDDGDRSRP